MHNNYYFLCRLNAELEERMIGSRLLDCYSQNKEELILRFSNQFNLKCLLQGNFSCFSSQEKIFRSKKNTATLFEPILGKKLQAVKTILNDRSFFLKFEDSHELLFKMHGNRSNIILFKSGKYISMFKNYLKNDQRLEPNSLNRPIDQNFEAFKQSDGNLSLIFPTFDKKVSTYLDQQGYSSSNLEGKWKIIAKTLKLLMRGKFYLILWKNKPALSMLPIGEITDTFEEAIPAINSFFINYLKFERIEKLKTGLLKEVHKEIKKLTNYINKTTRELKTLNDGPGYRMMGDLLMANLGQVPAYSKEIILPSFEDGSPVKIKLNPRLSVQKNAETYYRKSKNLQIQITLAEKGLSEKKAALEKQLARERAIQKAEEISELEMLQSPIEAKKEEQKSLPYKKFTYMDYEIRVGKNAKANDKLTTTFAKKDDLWLHAKDSTGSHVVVKKKPGSNVPEVVIEKAAELAAYFSKRKGESFCPVIYTQKKYVRKRKGSPPGTVIVEKEKVILAEPKK